MKKLIAILLAASTALGQTNVQKGSGNVLSNGSIVVGNNTSITTSGNGTIAATSATNLPSGTTQDGIIIATAITDPVNPPAGKGYIFFDSTHNNYNAKNNAGVTLNMVSPNTVVTNQFVTSIGRNGTITTAQPTLSNISGFGSGWPTTLAAATGTTGQVLASNGTSYVPTTLAPSTTVQGTANQVLASGTSGTPQSGNVILTTPQDIATISSPTFAGLNLSVNLASTSTITSTRAGIGAVSTDALLALNTTAATNGQAQYSPRLRWRGAGYYTGGTASKTFDIYADLRSIASGTASTSDVISSWGLYRSVNSGAEESLFHIKSDGPGLAAGTVTMSLGNNSAPTTTTNYLFQAPTGASSTISMSGMGGNIKLVSASFYPNSSGETLGLLANPWTAFLANATVIGTNTLKFGATAAATIAVSADATTANLVLTPPSTGNVSVASGNLSLSNSGLVSWPGLGNSISAGSGGTTQFIGSPTPNSDGLSYSLGASNLRWNNLFLGGTIRVGNGSTGGTMSMNGDELTLVGGTTGASGYVKAVGSSSDAQFYVGTTTNATNNSFAIGRNPNDGIIRLNSTSSGNMEFQFGGTTKAVLESGGAFRLGNRTAGPTIAASGTSPNESLVLTPAGTGTVNIAGSGKLLNTTTSSFVSLASDGTNNLSISSTSGVVLYSGSDRIQLGGGVGAGAFAPVTTVTLGAPSYPWGTTYISRPGIATTGTTGLQLANTTASTAGVPVQYSPRVLFTGHAWNTTATAADNYLEAINELRPASAATPTSTLAWGFRRSTDGATGSFTDAMTLGSDGNLKIGGTTYGFITNANTNGITFRTDGGQALYLGGNDGVSSGLILAVGGFQVNGSLTPYTDSDSGHPLGRSGKRWYELFLSRTITASGTTGAQTINKASGTVNFAATATSLVVTNSLVTTSSIIIATVGTNDTTMKSVQVVAGSGSFTIYANAAATAETRVNFFVLN